MAVATLAWRARPSYAVAVLTVAYVLSFVDRTIMAPLVGPIRADLGLSDVEVSLLHGLAFALFYTGVGIPIAWLADRASRRGLIAAGIAFWSTMTALCGFAGNFLQLFLARIGVAVGEAALTPAAYSMIADLYRGRRMATALSLFTLGLPIGAGLALLGGGLIAEWAAAGDGVVLPLVGRLAAWQVVFLAVGVPGIAIALLALSIVEPARSLQRPAAGEPVWAAASYLGTHVWVFAGVILGFSSLAVVANALQFWSIQHLTRNFEVPLGEAASIVGVAVLIAGSGGLVIGGRLADAWQRNGVRDAALRVGIVAALGGLPCLALLGLAGDRTLVALGIWGTAFFSVFCYGAAAAAVQLITPVRFRAQISAFYLFVLNVCGIGLAPLLVALAMRDVFNSETAVGESLLLVAGAASVLAAGLLSVTRGAYARAVERVAESNP